MNLKIILGILVLLPVLAHLGYAVANSTFANYYVTVDEYTGRVAAGNSSPRVGGQVVPGSIQWDNSTRTTRFQIAGTNSTLDVSYRSPAPDSFRDGATAILEGTRGPNGIFGATSISVRCPHQYLPAE